MSECQIINTALISLLKFIYTALTKKDDHGFSIRHHGRLCPLHEYLRLLGVRALDVRLEVALLREGERAERADERPLPRVALHVSLQRVLLREGGAAHLARERLGAGVRARVALELRRLGEGLRAVGTLVLQRLGWFTIVGRRIDSDFPLFFVYLWL